jgi:L-threonylcarbamoyladenylate synthase
VLRPGGLSREELEAVTGALVSGATFREAEPRPSPGLIERHYAPQFALHLVPPEAIDRATAEAATLHAAGRAVAVVRRGVSESAPSFVLRMPEDAVQYARALYAMLHELEDRECAEAWVEDVPPSPEWDAIRDRLRRATVSTPDPHP